MSRTRRPVAAALLSAVLVAGLAGPSDAAPPRTRTYTDAQSDATRYTSPPVPAAYSDLGELYRARVFTEGTWLKIQFGLRNVIPDDVRIWTKLVATFHIGSEYLVARISSEERSTLAIERGSDYAELCAGKVRKSDQPEYDRSTIAIPLSCLPAGQDLKMSVVGSDVYYRTKVGAKYNSIATDSMSPLPGKVRIR